MATALPAIAAAFGDVEYLSWIVVANLIASTVAAPAYGRLGDAFGRRRMMMVALVIFMAASSLCALAPSFWLLLAARVLQGLGSGGLMTLAQALIGEHVPPRQSGSYQGYLSANIVAGTTVGPVMGGFITQAFGWHAVFLAYLPLGLLAMVLLMRLPPGVPRQPARRVRHVRHGAADQLHRAAAADGVAVAAADRGGAAGLGGIAGADRGRGWSRCCGSSVGRRAPLLALPLMRIPAFWRSTVMGACSGASLTAMMTFLPIYLEVVAGASPGRVRAAADPADRSGEFGISADRLADLAHRPDGDLSGGWAD